MTDAEIRLACLKLAIKEIAADADEVVARASAYAGFVISGGAIDGDADRPILERGFTQSDGLWSDARGRRIWSPEERRQMHAGRSKISLRWDRMRAALRAIANFGGQPGGR